jgi:hypothetical protein
MMNSALSGGLQINFMISVDTLLKTIYNTFVFSIIVWLLIYTWRCINVKKISNIAENWARV